MFDVQVDESLDLVFGPSGDLRPLTGKDLDRQRLRVLIIAEYDSFIGEVGQKNISRKLELAADRISRVLEFVESVSRVTVEQSDDDPNTLIVTVLYDTDDEFVFDI